MPTQLPSHTECFDGPFALVAVTEKRYQTPFVRLMTVADVDADTVVHRTEQWWLLDTVMSHEHFET